jgi:hypothetical protein
VWVTDVQTESAFSASKPRLVFEQQGYDTTDSIRGWDISLDGQRFLMVQPVEPEQPATQINLVLNWFEELKRLAPTK